MILACHCGSLSTWSKDVRPGDPRCRRHRLDPQLRHQRRLWRPDQGRQLMHPGAVMPRRTAQQPPLLSPLSLRDRQSDFYRVSKPKLESVVGLKARPRQRPLAPRIGAEAEPSGISYLLASSSRGLAALRPSSPATVGTGSSPRSTGARPAEPSRLFTRTPRVSRNWGSAD